MMLKKMEILCCILFLTFNNIGCKDEAVKPNSSQSNIYKQVPFTLDSIWRSYLDENKMETFSINPILNSNNDILMSAWGSSSKSEIFKLYDGVTGSLKWQWSDYYRKEEIFNDERHIVINDALILCSHNATYALDILTGQTIWKHYADTMYGEPFIFKDEDGYIYHSFTGEHGNATCYIFRTKYDQLKWELVCSYNDTISFNRMGSTSIAFSKNSKGEKIMIYTLYLVSAQNKTMSRVCGFNMDTKQTEWVKDYTDKYIEFRVCKMASSVNRVYTFAVNGATWYLVAINATDGSIAWDNVLPDFGVSMHLYKDNIVALCNGSSPINCYNQNNGNLVWQQNFTPADIAKLNFTFGDANVFKNYLFSTQCSNLLVLNLDNGSVVFNKQVALPEGCLQYGIAINEQKRWFYVQDRYNVLCYKLPVEVKY